jgi:hypothetical protein
MERKIEWNKIEKSVERGMERKMNNVRLKSTGISRGSWKDKKLMECSRKEGTKREHKNRSRRGTEKRG